MVMLCPHGGTATVVPSGPGALVNGMPIATLADQIVVAGCAAVPPCAMVQWANTSRVLINGVPMLTQAPPPPGPGNGVCVGSATPGPPQVMSMQLFVIGL
jgi:hypothetical protein